MQHNLHVIVIISVRVGAVYIIDLISQSPKAGWGDGSLICSFLQGVNGQLR